MKNHFSILLLCAAAVFFATPGKAQWSEKQKEASLEIFYDMGFFSSTTGICVGLYDPGIGNGHPIVKRTTDGGKSWSNIDVSSFQFGLNSLSIIDANLAVAAGNLLMVTPDAGATWDTLPFLVQNVSRADVYFEQIACPDALNGFALCYDGTGDILVKTSNSGKTWAKCYNNPNGLTYGHLYVVDAMNIFVLCPTDNKILKTTDGGSNWQEVSMSGKVTGMNKMVKTSDAYYIVGDSSIWRSTDFQTWTKASLSQKIALFGIYFMDTADGFAYGSGEQMFRTVDGGASWHYEYAASGSSPVYDLTKVYFSDKRTGISLANNTLHSALMYYSVAPLAADFTASATSATTKDSITFNNTSTGPASLPPTYTWSFTPSGSETYVGGTSGSSKNPVVKFPTAGTYSVTLKAVNLIDSSISTKTNYINITAASGIPSVFHSSEVRVYPNPAAENVTVLLGETGYKQARLYNLMGQEISCPSVYNGSSLRLDVSALARGAYILQLSGSSGSVRQKLLVQ